MIQTKGSMSTIVITNIIAQVMIARFHSQRKAADCTKTAC